MSSYQNFTPGKKSNSRRVINYIAQYNNSNIDRSELKCVCTQDKFDKNLSNVGSDSPSIRISNNMRISEIVNFYRGGKTQYGNFYLGKPLNINYLGRVEGMSGGSGTPPVNRF
jgi:hypothetical protein